MSNVYSLDNARKKKTVMAVPFPEDLLLTMAEEAVRSDGEVNNIKIAKGIYSFFSDAGFDTSIEIGVVMGHIINNEVEIIDVEFEDQDAAINAFLSMVIDDHDLELFAVQDTAAITSH